MKITLNGVPRDVVAERLDKLLVELGFGEAKVATAVNEEFVPAARRAEAIIADGDRLEVVAPQQGG